MMTRHLTTSLLPLTLAISLLSGCSSLYEKGDSDVIPDNVKQVESLPSWVTKQPTDKTKAYGVGSMEVYGSPDQALKRAADFARADLVSRLKVTISATNSSRINEYTTDGETRLQKNISQTISSTIPTVTLDEVVIRDTYVDDNYAYALAELDRTAAASRIKGQLQEVETELEMMKSAQVTGTGKLERLQQQLPALALFAQHDQLAEQYAFVATSRTRPQAPQALRDYRDDILAAVKELDVRLVLLDDGARIMRGGLFETLTSQGLRLGESDTPDLSFEVSANLDSQQQDGNYYVFANARVNLRDSSGKVLSSFSDKARGVSGIQQNALNKASEKLAEQLSEELAATLTQRLR